MMFVSSRINLKERVALADTLPRSSDAPELRWGQRIAVDLPVHIALAHHPWTAARLVELSMTGALIDSDVRPRLLSIVVVIIDAAATFPESDWRRIVGYVSRIDRRGLAVEWSVIAAPAVIDLVRVGDGSRA